MLQPSNKHYLLDYSQLNEKGLAPLVKAIGTGGFNVAKVIPAGTSRKKDGIATKTFSLVGEDEQIMQVQVNDTGDISGVKLNGKNMPFQHSETINNVGDALARLFSGTATAFEKALAKKLAKAATSASDTGTKGPAVKSNSQLLSEEKARRDAAKTDVVASQAELSATQTTVDKQQSLAQQLSQQLVTEQSLTKQLKEQIAKAQGGS